MTRALRLRPAALFALAALSLAALSLAALSLAAAPALAQPPEEPADTVEQAPEEPAEPPPPAEEPEQTAEPREPAPRPQPRPAPAPRPQPAQAPEQPARLQLREPEVLQAPDTDNSGLQLQPPSTLGDETYDDALDEMLDEPWPDEESDGDFGQPLEGELDPDIADTLDEEFGEPGEEHATEGEHAEEHGPASVDEGHGEEHEAHGFDAISFLATLVNFLIWLALVIWLGRKPVSEFLANRRLAVEEGIEEAKRLQEEAREKHADYSARLERLDEELEKLRGEMIQAGEAESDRIIQEAEARAARMRKDATFLIDQQMKQLRVDLTREAIEAAVTAAEKVLTEQVAATDQQRLADVYLQQIARSITDEAALGDRERRS